MVEKIVFVDTWQSVFAGWELKSFDDFFDYSDGERINKNNKRDVSILTFGDGPERKVFFIKRFYNPHYKDILATRLNFGRFLSQASCEWENANLLLENGIETYRPVCFGERMRCGLERRSLFLTEKIQGCCLTEFVVHNWPHMTQQKKEKIIVSQEQAVRRMHDAEISLPDLYVWHIFIKQSSNPDEWEFAFIDLHRMKHNVTDRNRQLPDLGRLDHSMLDEFFDGTMRRLFIESYAGTDWPGGIAKLAKKVKKYSDAVSSKRNPKPY